MALSKLAIHYLEEFRDIIEADPPLAPSRLEQVLYNQDDSLSSIPVKQILLLYANITKQGKIEVLVNREGRARFTIEDLWSSTILFDCDTQFNSDTLPGRGDIFYFIKLFLSLDPRSYSNLPISIVRIG